MLRRRLLRMGARATAAAVALLFAGGAAAHASVTVTTLPVEFVAGQPTLLGEVTTENEPITVAFDIGPTVSYDRREVVSTVPANTRERVALRVTDGGMAAGGTYHYRFVAGGAPASLAAADIARGADVSFSIGPPPGGGLPGRRCSVPLLIGNPLGQAESIAAAAGCRLKVDRSKHCAGAAPDCVVTSQSPFSEGKLLPRGHKTIRVRFRKAEPFPATVPAHTMLRRIGNAPTPR